jgi:Flp pilus assembly protein TadG
MKLLSERLARECRCIAALEFALLAPVFVMVFAGVVDIGNALYTWSRLESALAVGANYALVNAGKVNSSNGAALASTIATLVSTSNAGTAADVTVVVDNGPTTVITNGTPVASGTAANANSCYCPTGSPPSSWAWGSVVTCGNTCAGSSTTAGKFVTITASYNFTAFFASYGFVSNGAMSSGAAVQTQ